MARCFLSLNKSKFCAKQFCKVYREHFCFRGVFCFVFRCWSCMLDEEEEKKIIHFCLQYFSWLWVYCPVKVWSSHAPPIRLYSTVYSLLDRPCCTGPLFTWAPDPVRTTAVISLCATSETTEDFVCMLVVSVSHACPSHVDRNGSHILSSLMLLLSRFEPRLVQTNNTDVQMTVQSHLVLD